MTMRTRAVLSTAALLLFAWALLYGVSVLLVRPQLKELEHTNVEQNTARAVDVFGSTIERLRITCLDWSAWDDTYDYAETRDTTFEDNNLGTVTLSNLNLNYMLLYDAKGAVLHEDAYDDDSEKITVPDVLRSNFARKGTLAAKDTEDTRQGILIDGDRAIVFASGPILTSEAKGPVRGTLVIARYVDTDDLAELAKQTDLKISFYTRSGTNLPADVRNIAGSLNANQTVVQKVSDIIDVGYTALNDVHGKPELIARVEVSRTMSREAIKGLDTYFVVAGLISLTLVLVNGHFMSMLMQKQRAIELKDEFFSIASHELRTPLTAIRGNSQIAQQMFAKDNPGLSEILNDIHSASERLIRIVNNFLDAARLEQGRLPFTFCDVDLQHTVQEVVDELQGLALEKKIYIHDDVSEHLDKAYADKDRLKQVIANLIGNAVKFTDEGGVTVTARQDRNLLIVSVNDTGRGISESGKKALFKKFRQTKSDDSQKGSGLGLYIARMLVQKMGGTIWLESSEEGHGTTISFSVPVAKK